MIDKELKPIPNPLEPNGLGGVQPDTGGYDQRVPYHNHDGINSPKLSPDEVDLAFTDLSDTPTSYTDKSGSLVAVKSSEDGLEFIAPSSGGTPGGDANDVQFHNPTGSFDGTNVFTYVEATQLLAVENLQLGVLNQYEVPFASSSVGLIDGDSNFFFTPSSQIQVGGTLGYLAVREITTPNTSDNAVTLSGRDSAGAGNAGTVNVITGDGTAFGKTGGNMNVTLGNAQDTAAGGTGNFTAGNGNGTGPGGGWILTAGDGGASDAAGGPIFLIGGSPGGSGGLGGHIYLQPGPTNNATGTHGRVIIGSQNDISNTSGVTDAYQGIQFAPSFTASSAKTITRYNYMEFLDVVLDASAALTDACLLATDSDPGTHKGLNIPTTKASPGNVDAGWLKINLNGTLCYVPAYTSPTS